MCMVNKTKQNIKNSMTWLRIGLETCWSFVEKTSVMQDPNPKCVQNFRWDIPLPVEASGGQEEYYIRLFCRSDWGSVRCTPSRGIWQPKAVLHQVSLTFTVKHQVSLTFTVRHTQNQMYHPVEASGGQEWYYIRSPWHLQSDISSP